MDVPATIAAESAITRQNVALSTLKQHADSDQKFAEIIEKTAKSAPISGTQGTNVDLFA